MTRTMFSSLVLAASFLLATSTAQAQVSTLRANIPFAFEAGGEVHQAGNYRLEINLGSSQITLSKLDQGREGAFLPPGFQTGTTTLGKAYLKFRRHGDQYFLREASNGQSRTLAWGPSKTEKKLTSPFEVALVYAQ